MRDARAVHMRANMTKAEVRLWRALRMKQVRGVRFRRQVRVGPYYADFLCYPARLIIEVDGDQHGHDSGRAHDARRDAYLTAQGFFVKRFWNDDVLLNLDGVITEIDLIVQERLHAT